MEEKKLKTALEPFQKEENWLAISITLAIIAVVLGGFGLLWIFEIGPIDDVDKRIKVATLVGTGLLALITYSTVIWRGLVGARQANEQKRANDAKDEENTAKLFIDATNCISQADSPQKYAGLVALEVLVASTSSKYSDAAMNIFADVVTAEITKINKSNSFEQARLAMKIGAEKGRFSSRDIISTAPHPNEQHLKLYGFNRVAYEGGRGPYSPIKFSSYNRQTTFKEVYFFSDEIHSSANLQFSACTLKSCSIRNVDVEELINNTYFSCNFSNSIVSKDGFDFFYLPKEIQRLTGTLNLCYYRIDSPPTGDGAHLILPYLEVRDRRAT